MGRIAELLHCDNSQMTWITDRLEEKGLVERQADPKDRRVKLLALTDEGRRVRDEIEAAARRPAARDRLAFGRRRPRAARSASQGAGARRRSDGAAPQRSSPSASPTSSAPAPSTRGSAGRRAPSPTTTSSSSRPAAWSSHSGTGRSSPRTRPSTTPAAGAGSRSPTTTRSPEEVDAVIAEAEAAGRDDRRGPARDVLGRLLGRLHRPRRPPVGGRPQPALDDRRGRLHPPDLVSPRGGGSAYARPV